MRRRSARGEAKKVEGGGCGGANFARASVAAFSPDEGAPTRQGAKPRRESVFAPSRATNESRRETPSASDLGPTPADPAVMPIKMIDLLLRPGWGWW